MAITQLCGLDVKEIEKVGKPCVTWQSAHRYGAIANSDWTGSAIGLNKEHEIDFDQPLQNFQAALYRKDCAQMGDLFMSSKDLLVKARRFVI